jgi:hypothetical protein
MQLTTAAPSGTELTVSTTLAELPSDVPAEPKKVARLERFVKSLTL